MNLDKETGISIMKISEKLDTGPIFCTYKIKIEDSDNAQLISDKLSKLASEKILDVVDDIIDDKIKPVEQDHRNATYANKIKKIEGKINWNKPARKIIGIINGLNPSPGAWFNFSGERYKILNAKISETNGKAGEVMNDKLEIGCSDLAIQVLEIQREGKQPQKINEFILGSKIKKGSILKYE